MRLRSDTLLENGHFWNTFVHLKKGHRQWWTPFSAPECCLHVALRNMAAASENPGTCQPKRGVGMLNLAVRKGPEDLSPLQVFSLTNSWSEGAHILIIGYEGKQHMSGCFKLYSL